MSKNNKKAISALIEQLDLDLEKGDRPGVLAGVLGAVNEGSISIEDLYLEVLTPLMQEIGARWQAGRIEIWQEHLASGIVRDTVDALSPKILEIKKREPANRGRVLLACPAAEHHDFGLRMMVDLFEMSGWQSFFLGADTPDDEIVSAGRELGVDAIVLSVSTHLNLIHLRAIAHRLVREFPEKRVWVAGSAFSHECQDWAADHFLDPHSINSNIGSSHA